MRRRLLPAASAALAGTLLVSGCSLFGGSVSKGDLEDKIHEEISAEAGEEPDEVRCEGDLEAEEDAEQSCAMGVEDEWVEIEVVATEVDGSDVEFQFRPTKQIDEPDY
ncbi:MAG: DUF4333 domain-containing protein [Corynebacterium sp.]|uniref:DUF4333 domain-containing protein n=1 Tax=Corynebacterium sp. TaxID=1720 RepID=UPI00264A44E7|nr:DUF4333 domain-containing protein [Corynebacterium sp.]MDN5721994.1 DUF4333 domain-containing protein [Corynebacterium sp.]